MDLHERLRDDLQATTVSNAAWPEFLLKLSDLLGASEAVLGGGDRSGANEFFAPRTDPDFVTRYREIFHQQNAVMRAVARQGTGAITLTDTLPEIDDFRRSDFYNLWCVPQKFNYGLALNLASSTGWFGSLVINTSSQVTTTQIEQLHAIAPDVQRAVERWKWLEQLQLANRMTLNTLDMAGQGALLLSQSGRVLDCNGMAQSMLTDGRLLLRDGQIGCADTASHQALVRLIAHCLAHPDKGGGRVQISGRDGALLVQCAPFSADMHYAAPQRPSAILMITDPTQRMRQRLRELTQRFGLTRAEIELALAVVETGSRKAAAEARGVSDATARAQLTSIFDKTGVRRQTELVRLLMYDG